VRTLGLIGGMSWESTQTYYQLLNRLARERLGGLHSADLLLRSVDFAGVAALQAAGDWNALTAMMVEAATALKSGGAQALVICTNTMHRMADEVSAAAGLPVIHIADATAAAVRKAGLKRPLLLGTRFTMEQAFYRDRLAAGGVEAVVPDADGRTLIHDVIYDELCRGVVDAGSRARVLDLIGRVGHEAGADGVILGCTEIGLLIGQDDLAMPVFDTTAVHAAAAMDFALA
jgi:aspartate racemase